MPRPPVVFPVVDLSLDAEAPKEYPCQEKRKASLARDAEWLTATQRAWVECVGDFRGTLYECARVAGYRQPMTAVQTCTKNPYVVRAILRRYHRKMMGLMRVLRPGQRITHDAPTPESKLTRKRGTMFVAVSGREGKALKAMRGPEGATAGSADSILGEKS